MEMEDILTKKIIWLVVSGLMVVSLLLMSCGAETPQNGEQAQVHEDSSPTYGGTLTLATSRDIVYWDSINTGSGGITRDLTHQRLWDGDWALGPAGTGECDWATSYDVRAFKMGYIAEDIEFIVEDNGEFGKIVYTIRQGVPFSLDPDNEASALVGGRDITADDVVAHLNRMFKTPGAYQYNIGNPLLHDAEITKTGPWEVTFRVPTTVLLEAGKRAGDSTMIEARELVEKYGDVKSWERQVGTGPFIIKDYVAANSATVVKNDDF